MDKGKTIELTNEVSVTKDEISIVQGWANSMRVKEIAREMGIPHRTLETKIDLMKKKYGVRTPAGFCALFYRNKLID